MKTDTEIREILRKALTNDRQALSEILNEYGPKMFYETRLFFFDRQKAKQVEQKALRTAFSKLKEAEAAPNIDEWFADIVEEEALKNLLPVNDPGAQYDDYTETDEMSTAYAEVPDSREECMAEILKVFDILPEDERIAAVLHFYKHMSVYETAAKMGITPGGARTLLTSAKTRIYQSGEDLGTFIGSIEEVHPEPAATNTLDLGTFKKPEEEPEPTIVVSGLEDIAAAETKKPVFEKPEKKPVPEIEINHQDDYYDDDDEDDDDDVPGKLGVFFKTLLTVLILAALGCGLYYWFYIRSGKEDTGTMPVASETQTPEPTPTPEVTETPTPTPTPEVTEEPDDGILGTVKVLVRQMNVRSGPGTNYRSVKTASAGEEYDVYDISESGNYTWYQIGENEWVADSAGTMLEYTEK